MTSERLDAEDRVEFNAAFDLLAKKPPELDPTIRTSARLSILFFKYRLGQIHSEEFNNQRAFILDNLATKDYQAAQTFRSLSRTDRRNFRPYLRACGLLDSED